MSGLYRKVSVRTWGDERFHRLSRLQPSAQGLWFFLLTGPHTTALPGLARASMVALAEELSWPVDDFERCFAELEAAGMAKADWTAKLLWLPNAIRHNEPANPNVLKHWSSAWEFLPECPLKAEAYETLAAYCAQRGESFAKTFAACFTRPSQNVPANVPGNPPETLGQTTPKSVAVAVAVTGAVAGAAGAPEPEAPASLPKAKKPRRPSAQEEFAAWFQERRREALGSEWVEDVHLPAKRLNTELSWVVGMDGALVSEAARLYLEDERRREQDPPCSLRWFAQDRAPYLSKAHRALGAA